MRLAMMVGDGPPNRGPGRVLRARGTDAGTGDAGRFVSALTLGRGKGPAGRPAVSSTPLLTRWSVLMVQRCRQSAAATMSRLDYVGVPG